MKTGYSFAAVACRPRFLLAAYLYVASFSLMTGIALFLGTLRWFPVADLLRSLLLDLLFLVPLLAVPWAAIPYLIVLYPFLAAACVINVMHIVLYRSTVSTFAIQSVMETTRAEAGEFIMDFLGFQSGLVLVAVTLIPLALLWRAARIAKNDSPTKNGVLVVSVLVLVCLGVGSAVVRKGDRLLRSHGAYLLMQTWKQYTEELSLLKDSREAARNHEFEDLRLLDGAPDTARTYVFVIGESANRNHLGLYGYKRPTTPRLSSLKDQLFVFSNVISSHTHTIPNLRNMFLFEGLTDGKNERESRISLFNLLNAAGFHTYWLSNQIMQNESSSGLALLISDIYERKITNFGNNEGRSVSYDGVLVSELQSVMEDPFPLKAIFIHLLGSHLTYALRYPKEFKIFDREDDIEDAPWRNAMSKYYINTYDNSILYTDHVLAELLDSVKARPERTAFLYVSDHGQEVYDTRPVRGQTASSPSKHMLDVPFVLWLSPEYVAANQEFAANLPGFLDRPYVTDGFPHAAAELMRVGFGGFKPERSIFWLVRRICG